MKDLRQQHQYQTLLQDDQLDKNMKKALTVIFCTNKSINVDKDIIDANDYLDKRDLAQNEEFINEKDSNIEPLNFDAAESLKNLLGNTYKKDELVQAIIDAKMKKLQKLSPKILKQVKLAIRDLEVKNDKLYIRGKIHISDNKKL